MCIVFVYVEHLYVLSVCDSHELAVVTYNN